MLSFLLCVVGIWCINGQDLFQFAPTFLEKFRSPGTTAFLARTPSRITTADSGSVFTISPWGKPTLCLDMTTGHGTTIVQIWECNGHESQLWYFDPGAFQIFWGGDRSKCIDAGQGMTAGTQLIVWPCNGSPQQKWGYDTTAHTIYLVSSQADATICMDLSGSKVDLGTPIQTWSCNNLWEQQWWLSVGITLRVLADYTYCLDIAGGKFDNGTPIQLWKCNGGVNQKWRFEANQISSIGSGFTKCIDSGQSGDFLMLWDCNGQPQQRFGYDANMNTIYLSGSSEDVDSLAGSGLGSGRALASMCFDVFAGQVKEGTKIDTWSCNGCWNQQFQVIGPASSADLEKGVALRDSNGLAGNAQCPSKPGPAPGPAPGPPAQGILPHCQDGNQYGWPKFDNQAALQGSAWGKYFQTVYGEVPSSGYPICIYGFNYVYPAITSQAGAQLPTLERVCPNKPGTYYDKMSSLTSSQAHWIWNPDLSHPSSNGLPDHHWVEFVHTAFHMDGSAMWAYYAPGTGIWLNTGNTKVYNDHGAAVKDLMHKPCLDPSNECIHDFEQLYAAIKSTGLQTIQFLKHADMQCDGIPGEANLAIEIIDTGGPGTKTCGGNGGQTRFKAGWEARHACNCNNNEKMINCQGFGVHR